MDRLNYLGKRPENQSPELNSLINLLRTPFGEIDQSILDRIQATLPTPEFNRLVSVEGLTGTPWVGAYDGLTVMYRIRQLFPKAKILITIRNQETMLRSLYGQYVLEGGTTKIGQFLSGEGDHWHFHPKQLYYDRIVSSYQSSFGCDGVRVIPYEHFRSRTKDTIEELASFLDCSFTSDGEDSLQETIRHGMSAPHTNMMRLFNHYRRSSIMPSNKFTGIGNSLTPLALTAKLTQIMKHIDRNAEKHYQEHIQSVIRQYSESNSKLCDMTGLDLEPLGYPLT